jgi:hypothetical protein
MEINFDKNIQLRYEIDPEQKIVVTVQDERLISHVDDFEISDGHQHHRLTVTITSESISG